MLLVIVVVDVGDRGVVAFCVVRVVDVSEVAMCSQLVWLMLVDDGSFGCRGL